MFLLKLNFSPPAHNLEGYSRYSLFGGTIPLTRDNMFLCKQNLSPPAHNLEGYSHYSLFRGITSLICDKYLDST